MESAQKVPRRRRLAFLVPALGLGLILALVLIAALGFASSSSGFIPGLNVFGVLLFLIFNPLELLFTSLTPSASFLFAFSAFPLLASLVGYGIDRARRRTHEESIPFSPRTTRIVFWSLLLAAVSSLAVGQKYMWFPPKKTSGNSINLVADKGGRSPEDVCREILNEEYDRRRCTSHTKPPGNRELYVAICRIDCK